MVEAGSVGPSLLSLSKSERYRRVLQYISSSTPAGPRLYFQAIRCTTPSCSCECFLPSKPSLRTCDTCNHGWVVHALDKLGYRHMFNAGLQVEIVQPNIVFDIASLMLYGAHATPIRLKILLDRLFSVLQHEEVLQVLHGFGWTYEDYARGYILQESTGRVLDKWMCATREEEFIIMQQFLRFGETKSIAQEIILADTKERQDSYIKQTSRSDSEIKKFIERSNMSMHSLIRPFDVRNLFGARLPFMAPGGGRLLSPPLGFSTPTSSPRDMRPPLIAVSTASPGTTSPLGRLQTMQPFDFRRETSSPSTLSPGEKLPTSSPKSESPQNFSVTSASTHSTPPHTPFTPLKMAETESPVSSHMPKVLHSVTLGAPALILPTLQRHHHSPDDGALNFSLKEDQDSSSYLERKNKHLRKSCNPIKRNWIPDPNFGTSMIGPNGKKRVLCTACNKTFCDKGALKIHYSAVHLKEMHRCTVDGCTMMFSSRRSRNRHSANPNPKLHMPQKRPKIPDGARLIDDGSSPGSKRQLSTPPSMLTAGMVSRSPVSQLESPQSTGYYPGSDIQLPVFPTAAKKLKLDSDDDSPRDLSLPLIKSSYSSRESSPGNASLSLVSNNMLDQYQNDIKVDFEDSQESDYSQDMNESTNSPGPARSQSRRKNIPVRFAQSVDGFGEARHNQLNDKTNKDDQSKEKDHENCQGDDVNNAIKDGTKDSNDDDDDGKESRSATEDVSMDKSDAKLVIVDEEYSSNTEGVGDDDDDDLEGRDTGEVLDFAMHMPDDIDNDNDNLSAMSSHESHNSDQEDSSDNGKQNEDIGEVDIPVNKENPKQCVACGNTFLNMNGMKIHYKNVHLKLMHTCTVEGCGASFPSKRSRDRHSSNLNLHRKLLSNSGDKDENSVTADDNQNFRADIIQKLYENPLGETPENNNGETVTNGDRINRAKDSGHENYDRENHVESVNGRASGMDEDELSVDSDHDSDHGSQVSDQVCVMHNNSNSKSPDDKTGLSVTRKSKRQISQGDLHKNMFTNEKTVSV